MHKTLKIGQIVPSSNLTMEREIPAMLRAREAQFPERFSFPFQPHAHEESDKGRAGGHGSRQRPLRT
ncbi:MAG: hypothetical protein R3D84_14415 [Paracoccaceae bacterium]